MSKKISFQMYVFITGMLLIASSCQGDDDMVPGDILGLDIDIAALPETILYPANNPYSPEKFELGKSLFWDPVLSGTKGVACASCHHPDFGYADGRDLSSGVNGIGLGPNRRAGEIVRRNAPTILNVAYNGIDLAGNYNPATAPMFWDNRASGLEEQAILPVLSKEEMRGDLIAEDDIVDTISQRLNAIPAYRNMFAAAYGDDAISEARIAQALATFQRSLVANNSRFDQYMRGDQNALSNQEVQGMNTFSQVGCVDCHSGPMLSDFELHTLSVPDHPLIADNGATGAFDFRTPTLRNLRFTAPYMHNGVFDDLRDVLDFYNDISGRNPDSQNANVNDNQIDQDARNLQLNGGQINELIAFLNTLNDEDFDTSIPVSVPSGLAVGGDID
ncbi:MAG: cytochrome-c peroxidase [Bacteroidia bacterium]